jgi:auxin efflux carrier family protein
VIPIWFVIVTSSSMMVGSTLGSLFRLRQSQRFIHFIIFFNSLSLISPNRSFVTAAAMFMNSNALPIALMQSLVVSVPDLMWGDDDNKDVMLGRALTYLTMYSTLGMVVRAIFSFFSCQRKI